MADEPQNQAPEAPVQPQAPTQPAAPVAPQSFENVPQGQPVQYVVAKKSLEGVSGWLAVWVVIAGLGGIGYIANALGESEALGMPAPIALLLGVAFFATAVLIAMRKKIAKEAAIGSIAASALVAIGTTLSEGVDNAASIILINLLFAGLVSLYFLQSERVKQTLTK